MNSRFVLTAMLLFVAAAGWIYQPPPLANERYHPETQNRLRRLRDRTIPIACVVLGFGILVAGMTHKPTHNENEHEPL
jgi:hypothetical protein